MTGRLRKSGSSTGELVLITTEKYPRTYFLRQVFDLQALDIREKRSPASDGEVNMTEWAAGYSIQVCRMNSNWCMIIGSRKYQWQADLK